MFAAEFARAPDPTTMKSTERHRLKQNEFARSVGRARASLQERQGVITKGLLALAVVLLAVAAYSWWRSAQETRADELLANALATYETPVVPPQPPAPGSPPPVPQPGTFQSEGERQEAALPQFLQVADAHPRSDAAVTARFHAASILAAMGRHAEAEEHYREVVERAGNRIYGRTARLGMAETQMAQGQYDRAIEVYTELSRETDAVLPLDAVLMQLGRAYARAGRTDDAVRSFTRVVDEFPQSPYAADARREMAAVKS